MQLEPSRVDPGWLEGLCPNCGKHTLDAAILPWDGQLTGKCSSCGIRGDMARFALELPKGGILQEYCDCREMLWQVFSDNFTSGIGSTKPLGMELMCGETTRPLREELSSYVGIAQNLHAITCFAKSEGFKLIVLNKGKGDEMQDIRCDKSYLVFRDEPFPGMLRSFLRLTEKGPRRSFCQWNLKSNMWRVAGRVSLGPGKYPIECLDLKELWKRRLATSSDRDIDYHMHYSTKGGQFQPFLH